MTLIEPCAAKWWEIGKTITHYCSEHDGLHTTPHRCRCGAEISTITPPPTTDDEQAALWAMQKEVLMRHYGDD